VTRGVAVPIGLLAASCAPGMERAAAPRAGRPQPVAAQVRGMKAIRRVVLANLAGENARAPAPSSTVGPERVWTAGHSVHLGRCGASHKNFAFAPVAGLPDRRGVVVGEEASR
jgi:hypothetical protein